MKPSSSILPIDCAPGDENLIHSKPACSSIHSYFEKRWAKISFIIFFVSSAFIFIFTCQHLSAPEYTGVIKRSAINIALSEGQIGCDSVLFASILSSAILINYIIDLSTHFLYGIVKLKQFEDFFERTMITAIGVIPIALPIAAYLGHYDSLPLIFTAVNCLQNSGYAFVASYVLNRAYPRIFTPFKSIVCSFTIYSSSTCAFVGLGLDIDNWVNIVAVCTIMIFSTFLSYLFYKVVLTENLLTRKISNFRREELYSIGFVSILGLCVTIKTTIYFCCYGQYSHFNSIACNIFAYTMLFKNYSIYFISSNVSSLRAEESVIKANEIADLRQDTIGFISHEIRTPLSIIDSSLRLGLADIDRAISSSNFEALVTAKDCVDDSLRACESATLVLNNVLSDVSMTSGKYNLTRDFVPIAAVVTDAMNRLKVLCLEKSITFTIDNLLAADYQVFLDEPKFRQVLMNLVTNSVKFVNHGGNIRVVLQANQNTVTIPVWSFDTRFSAELSHAGSVLVQIIDDGIGISPDNLGKVFEQFSQFDPNKLQGGGGTGLGLFISKKIVDAHEGKISVSSQGVGKGSCFTIELTAYQCNKLSEKSSKSAIGQSDLSESVSHAISHRRRLSIASDLCHLRALVVDDSKICRKSLIRTLQNIIDSNKYGVTFTIEEAEDGVEMVNKVNRDINKGNDSFDIIFVDNTMNVMHGPEATKTVRDLGYNGIVIAVTGNVLKRDVDTFRKAGADEVLGKPFQFNMLENILQAMLHH